MSTGQLSHWNERTLPVNKIQVTLKVKENKKVSFLYERKERNKDKQKVRRDKKHSRNQ